MPAHHKNICIVGGGVIGVCTAYYLLEDPSFDPSCMTVTLIEDHDIAGAASGKAAGFLALDWHGSATASLAELSFRLHLALAERFGGANAWGFRAMDSVSMSVVANKRAKTHPEDSLKSPEPNPALEGSATREVPCSIDGAVEAEWLNKDADISVCGTTSTTAQVHPRLFTQALFAHAQDKGLRYVQGRPSAFARHGSGTLDIHRINDTQLSLPCTDLVLTCGPWTAQVAEELSIRPIPRISNLPGHSLLIRPCTPISAVAVFASIYNANTAQSRRAFGGTMTESPELFPRPDGTVYLAGENHAKEMPRNARDVEALIDEEMIGRLLRASTQISGRLSEGQVETKQLCYRPTTPDGRPLVGRLCDGVWVAAGHGPWGITLSAGTGKVMAEMLLQGVSKSADVAALDPRRFS